MDGNGFYPRAIGSGWDGLQNNFIALKPITKENNNGSGDGIVVLPMHKIGGDLMYCQSTSCEFARKANADISKNKDKMTVITFIEFQTTL